MSGLCRRWLAAAPKSRSRIGASRRITVAAAAGQKNAAQSQPQRRGMAGGAAAAAAPPPPPRVFDRAVKMAQRHRAATAAIARARAAGAMIVPPSDPSAAAGSGDAAAALRAGSEYDYLRDEVADRMVDRLIDISRSFPKAADLGCGALHMARALARAQQRRDASLSAALHAPQADTASATSAPSATGAADTTASASASTTASEQQYHSRVPGNISSLLSIDGCRPLMERGRLRFDREHPPALAGGAGAPIGFAQQFSVTDEELVSSAGAASVSPNEVAASLLPTASFDLVTSCLSLHWMNDLPRVLSNVRRALKPDGAFLGCMLGGATLQELRSAMAVADMERLGGVTPHVSPFAHMRDCGDLLTRAGFNLPTVDNDVLTVRFPDLFTLCDHLQNMAENNAVLTRAPHVSRDVFMSAAAAYQELYADEDGLIPATFQVLYMIGWAPHPSQAKPLARGSATHHISALNTAAKKPNT